MKPCNFPAPLLTPAIVYLGLSWLCVALCPCANANVYASNIRVNGGLTNVSLNGSVKISYVLNEPATAGVIVRIKSGLSVLRTFTFTNEQPGALRGTNIVLWNGQDNLSNSVSPGAYSIEITASATGYADWKQISDDGSLGNYVWEARGITVNQNPSSPYYGRVFVANAYQGVNTNANVGDRIGILKLNADGSQAEEGTFSTGGWNWSGEYVSPWKLEVADDDRVYVNDWIGSGVVLSFDQTVSAASRRVVLRDDNWPNAGAVNFSGLSVSGPADSMKVWMADIMMAGVGIRRWPISTNGIVATNDVGITVVAAGGGSDVNLAPWDVAVDRSNRIYTIQYETELASTLADHLLCFPPYDEVAPQTVSTWKLGATMETMGAHGVAVNPAGTYVGVAFQRVLLGGDFQNGSVRVYYTTNGSLVATPTAGHLFNQDYRDLAWDKVGNLYVLDNYNLVWRTYSPPGTNQAVTVAAMNVNVNLPGPIRPVLSEPSYINGQFSCFLTGEPNVVYYLEASTNLSTWQVVATNTSAVAKRPITVAAPNKHSFYRAFAGAAATARPTLSSPVYGAGQFQFVLTGQANVSYIIQSSLDLQNWTSVLTNNSASATRPISVNAPGTRSFYRALVTP